MALREDFKQDWAAAGDNSSKRGASLNRGFATLEGNGVDVALRRSLLHDGKPDRWRAQFDAALWIEQGLMSLDAAVTEGSGLNG